MPPMSRGTSSAYLSSLFLLFGPSCQVRYAVLQDFRIFLPTHLPFSDDPTHLFSVLQPSIFAIYLNLAKAVSGCNDSENGLLHNTTFANDLQLSCNLQISQFKSIMYKYYVDVLEHNYDPKDPRSWKTICPSCNISLNVSVHLRCCFQSPYVALLFVFIETFLNSWTTVIIIGLPLFWYPCLIYHLLFLVSTIPCTYSFIFLYSCNR